MPLRGANLFFDQIEVIQQPFCRGRHLPSGLDRLRQLIARIDDDVFIFGETRQQQVASTLGIEFVSVGQDAPVLLHLQDAEQLGAQRQLFILLPTSSFFGQKIIFEIDKIIMQGWVVWFQF